MIIIDVLVDCMISFGRGEGRRGGSLRVGRAADRQRTG